MANNLQSVNMKIRTAPMLILAAAGIALMAVAALASALGFKRFDGWNAAEIEVLSSLHISQLPPAPKDVSNTHETSPEAVRLGEKLFFDRRFSSDGAVSCASCHQPEKQFQDGKPLGLGVGIGSRRTMPIVETGRSPFLFWDGRKDSLWSQALGPLEDPVEHGGNRLAYAHLLRTHYRPDYETIFGTLPDLSGAPVNAGPNGSPAEKSAWQSLPHATQEAVSRVFANMGKALAAYQKTFRYGESRVDRYISGVLTKDDSVLTVLNEQEKNGLRIFIGKGNCVTCHNGPLLTDQHFHNTGIAPRLPEAPDLGRFAAIEKVRTDEFNCLSRYSDAKPELCEELNFLAPPDHQMVAAFKTPSLRNAALRPPYMHAGQIPDLAAVVRHYAMAPQSAAGHTELRPLSLTEDEIQDVVALLKAFSGPILRYR